MTENKRFAAIGENVWQDGEVWCVAGGKHCADVIATAMNELHEENHQLKRQIGNLEHTRDFCAECCERLEKENEQLKSEISEVRGEYEQLWMRL